MEGDTSNDLVNSGQKININSKNNFFEVETWTGNLNLIEDDAN